MSGTPTAGYESVGRAAASKPIGLPVENVPNEVGQYRLLGPLGKGGMGQVFKAIHLHLKREVAIKFLRGLHADSEQSRKRFLTEMEALGRLDHPNIVRATDAGDWQGQPYLVMECLKGSDLDKLVAALGPLPIREVCEIARQTACGLQYAYDKGLIHRDLKPGNLFLTEEGCVKILDLGLARIQDELGASGMTPDGAILGTLDYMAPEQASDSHKVDVRADLYSLGCTLYHLLTGIPPFHSSTPRSAAQKIRAHSELAPRPIREIRSDVPVELARLLDRLLAKRPEDRFALPRDLEPILRSLAVGADLTGLIAAYRDRSAADSAPTQSQIHVSPGATETHVPLPLTQSRSDATEAVVPGPSSQAQPTVPRPKLRPSIGIAVVLGLPLLLTAGAVLLAWSAHWLDRSNSTPSTTPVTPPVASNLTTEPASGIDDGNLLAKRPSLLLEPNRNFLLDYDPQKQEFSYIANDLCLFQLGEAPAADYEFEVGLTRNAATDEVGVFFGYQRGPYQGRSDVGRLYAFSIRPLDPMVGRRESVALELFPRYIDFENGNRHQPTLLLSLSLPSLPPTEQRVRVRVAQGKITRLACGPHDLADQIKMMPPASDLTGGFGVYCEKASGFVRSARLITPKKET